MAERRMFAKTIIDSDAFLDMPTSSQALYFHLSMRADDDGFINNPKKIQRAVGASEDDLRLLIAKNFIIPFDSGVVVIKHWKIHNYIQNDRYKPTAYLEEKNMLSVKENKAYTLDVPTLDTDCIHDGYRLETQVRLGKDSIGKDNNKVLSNDNTSSVKNDEHGTYQWLVDAWNALSKYGIKPIRSIVSGSTRQNLVQGRTKQYGKDAILEAIENIKYSDFLKGGSKRGWTITFDWFIKPSNFAKVLEGNYGMKPKDTPSVTESPQEEEFDLEKWERENGFV